MSSNVSWHHRIFHFPVFILFEEEEDWSATRAWKRANWNTIVNTQNISWNDTFPNLVFHPSSPNWDLYQCRSWQRLVFHYHGRISHPYEGEVRQDSQMHHLRKIDVCVLFFKRRQDFLRNSISYLYILVIELPSLEVSVDLSVPSNYLLICERTRNFVK